jgi:hypothetical protein
MSISLHERVLDTHEKRMEYNVRRQCVHAFVRAGLAPFNKADNLVAIFFGEGDEIDECLRVEPELKLVFETFKTEEQVRSWRGYSVELSDKNPLAMIFKLSGENPNWVQI